MLDVRDVAVLADKLMDILGLGISFDNKTALLPFISIPHYGCCSAALGNPHCQYEE